jgi:pyruvate/2-oxoglutarate dehydrogenase complex dihydrolipoamide acyltransferase (E2) component
VTDTVIRMPKLADTLVEGTLGQWLKQPGDHVNSGEPLASIETDKVTTELTSPTAGTVLEFLVSAGQTVPIDTPIARIGSPRPDSPRAEEEFDQARRAGESAAPPTRITPVAARLLAEHRVSAEEIPAATRRLTKRDVLAYVETRHRPSPAPLSSMRRAIADHMSRARKEIPHGQTVVAADLTTLVAWRERQAPKPTFTAFFVHVLARTMDPPAHIGVAVALDNGLIVPVIRNADALSLVDTASAIADLADRARTNRLAPDATQGATTTVTNVGSFGNVFASPIVPLGQQAILAPGIVERRPLRGPDGGVRLGWQCLLSLVYDRRVFDELAADRFLGRIVRELGAFGT